jgi:hypothetical protein
MKEEGKANGGEEEYIKINRSGQTFIKIVFGEKRQKCI